MVKNPVKTESNRSWVSMDREIDPSNGLVYGTLFKVHCFLEISLSEKTKKPHIWKLLVRTAFGPAGLWMHGLANFDSDFLFLIGVNNFLS